MKAILDEQEWNLFERLRKVYKAGKIPQRHLSALRRTQELYERHKESLGKTLRQEGLKDAPILSSFKKTLDDFINELQVHIAEIEAEWRKEQK
jgi:hypothetical protein